MTFKPTPEQVAIVEAAKNTTDNLMIEALAGAAKTSTLVMIAEALPDVQILCLAFNKKIADEMRTRLPDNCTAMTLNALGHRVWGEATGRRLQINAGKVAGILKELIQTMPRKEQEEAWGRYGETLKIIELGKASGYIPSGKFERAKRLMDCSDFFAALDTKIEAWEERLVREATLISLERAMKGDCDFNDQILMPTVFHGAFPRYALVLIDEAQDLSQLNHATLQKLAKRRLIAVGDSRQAIYGFRGADSSSMSKLSEKFSMTKLELTVSFRCPKAVVKEARSHAPAMKYPDWAAEGSVTTLTSWSESDVPSSAAILCRNNAPLFSMALKLLREGRNCELSSGEIGKKLVKVMTKFGQGNDSSAMALNQLNSWKEKELSKARHGAASRINDMYACMSMFLENSETLGDALHLAQHILSQQGPLKLMTGHGSKGLEFDNVFILDRSLISKEGQDPNLRYVMQTRAKKTLTYITSEAFVSSRAE